MIELPKPFETSLNKKVTSLYPLIRIFKGVSLGGDINDNLGVINLSTKSVTIGGENFKPLLLESPRIASRADIVDRKYKISNVNITISNAEYKGEVISEDVNEMLNSVCKIYYAANNLHNLDDCLLVYTGTIRRMETDRTKFKLILEDATQQTLSTNIPVNLVPEEREYKIEDQGKPFPLTYGRMRNAPTIRTVVVNPETNMPNQDQLFEILCEAPDIEIGGPLAKSADEAYNNEAFDSNHFLIDKSWISNEYFLNIYDESTIPINRFVPKKFNGEDTYTGTELYVVDTDTKSRITLNVLGDQSVLLARILRLFSGASFNVRKQVKSVSNDISWRDATSYTYFYGYDYIDGWDPRTRYGSYWWSSGTSATDPGKTEYENNWSDGGQHSWWQPTSINEMSDVDQMLWSSVDDGWWDNIDGQGFPIKWIENNSQNYGLYMSSLAPAFADFNPYSGGMAKFNVTEVGSFPCTTNIHSKIRMVTPHALGVEDHIEFTDRQKWVESVSFPSSCWVEPDSIRYEYDPVYDDMAITLSDLLDNIQTNEEAGNEGSDSPYNDDAQVYLGGNEKVIIDTSDAYNEGSGQTSLMETYDILGAWNNTSRYANLYWGAEYHEGEPVSSNSDVSIRNCNALLSNLHITQDIRIDELHSREFFVDIEGRKRWQRDEVATNAKEFLESIVKSELQADFNVIDISEDHDMLAGGSEADWLNAFSLKSQKKALKIIQDMFQSSLNMTTFNSNGDMTVIPIYQILNDDISNIQHITNNDIYSYRFSYTKLDDIKNQINVKYNYNLASDEFDSETGYAFEYNSNKYETYDEVTQAIYPTEMEYQYDIGFYNLTDTEGRLEYESKYINDKVTAQRLQKSLVSWYANQHLIVDMKLNITFMHLEAGDYITFDELIGGQKAFGNDYTRNINKNGQLIYKYFFITKVSKTVKDVAIQAVQVHRGEYGFPEGWETYSDGTDNDLVDGGGNNGMGNYILPDPQDDQKDKNAKI